MKELFICYKIRKHKRDIIAKFLDIDANKIRFCSFKFTIKLLAHKFHLTVLQWASQEDVSLTQFCKRNNITCIFVEDGFIRSKGLGALHNKPYSLVFDKEGIYYNPKASSLVTILNNLKNRDDYQSLIKRAQVLKQQIIKNHISKYNLVSSLQEEELNKLKEILPKDKKIILVPGQVEGDASIIKGGMGISTNQELLRLVKEKNKDAFIIYKQHPDIVSGQRFAYDDLESKDYYDFILYYSNIISVFDYVDEIHTLTSQTGFEALIRNKKVFVYGMPFYASWGLTQDIYKDENRNTSLTIDELVAGALILYPSYFNWDSMKKCQVEDILDNLKS